MLGRVSLKAEKGSISLSSSCTTPVLDPSLYLTKRKPRTLTMNLSKLSLNLILWMRSADSGMFAVN